MTEINISNIIADINNNDDIEELINYFDFISSDYEQIKQYIENRINIILEDNINPLINKKYKDYDNGLHLLAECLNNINIDYLTLEE